MAVIGDPIFVGGWVHSLRAVIYVAQDIERALLPFHEKPLYLESLEERPDKALYDRQYRNALEMLGIESTHIVEISLSEAMLPVDSLAGTTSQMQRAVRLGIAGGIGNGVRTHFSDHLQERYVPQLAENEQFNLETSGLLDRMLSTSVINSQLWLLNQKYNDVFRSTIIGKNHLPFALPAVLYYQIALRLQHAYKDADAIAKMNRFILDGHPPLGMLHDDSFAVLGR